MKLECRWIAGRKLGRVKERVDGYDFLEKCRQDAWFNHKAIGAGSKLGRVEERIDGYNLLEKSRHDA